MTSCSAAIINPLGLHARAAARFVHVAAGFSSSIRVGRGPREIDGKSIMGLLLLSAAQGCHITITVDGADEKQALDALCALVQRGFDEAPFDSAQAKPFDNAQGKPFDNAQAKPFDSAQGKPCA